MMLDFCLKLKYDLMRNKIIRRTLINFLDNKIN